MAVQHINRITGDQNAAAPLYQQNNGNERNPVPLTSWLLGSPFSIASQAASPHRLLFMQALFLGLYISEIRFEELNGQTGLAIIGIILGLWCIFYIPLLNIIAKITMSALYALAGYRIIMWLNPDIPRTSEVFNIKHIATNAPIADSAWLYAGCVLIFLVTLFMQRSLPLSDL